jgi:16S rRNA (guanine527-N7)-methyltransferase
MEEILKYFPHLTARQIEQLASLDSVYREWNANINVISRKDIDQLYKHHVLHSLAISKWINFVPGTRILDVGCGGGFPSIPLAILFPEVKFHLIDSVRKKLTVVMEVADHVSLTNIKTTHIRAEEVKDKYDFVITRAVADMSRLLSWTYNNISSKHKNPFPNGHIALKGGDLSAELKPLRKKEYIEQIAIGQYYDDPYFDEKFIVYIQGG